MSTTTKNINVLSLSDVKTPLENQIYNADSQNWIWRNGKWNVVIDISNVNDLSKVKPRIYANGLEQPTVFFKNGKEYNPLGGSNTSSVVNSTPNTTKNYSDEIYAFQKWLRDTYGNAVDLGNYGKNKDGIDGKFGAKTKALWDKYGDKYSESQKLIPIGTQKIKGTSNIPDLSNLKKTSNNSAVTDALNKARAEYEAKTLGKDLADTKMLRNRGIADMIPTIAGGAYGLGQLIKGNNLSKKLKPPKRVEQLLPNQQLATMLAKASVNSEVVDPKIKEEAIRAMTTNRELANEMARVGSGGDITAYSQNAQNNYMKSNDAVRKLASDSQADLYKNRAQLESLITSKMSEDRDLYNDRLNEFNKIDYPEFVGARKYAADLTNTGMTNVMGALNNGVANAPILQGTKNIMSGYKARYASMSPAEKKVFATNYPKLAAKYEMEDKMPVGGVIVQPEIVDQPIQPQYLPQMPLGANWRQY